MKTIEELRAQRDALIAERASQVQSITGTLASSESPADRLTLAEWQLGRIEDELDGIETVLDSTDDQHLKEYLPGRVAYLTEQQGLLEKEIDDLTERQELEVEINRLQAENLKRKETNQLSEKPATASGLRVKM